MNNFESRIKYLCLLGHRQNKTAPEYGKWQKKIIEKYNLWAFNRIEPNQVEKEIDRMEKELGYRNTQLPL